MNFILKLKVFHLEISKLEIRRKLIMRRKSESSFESSWRPILRVAHLNPPFGYVFKFLVRTSIRICIWIPRLDFHLNPRLNLLTKRTLLDRGFNDWSLIILSSLSVLNSQNDKSLRNAQLAATSSPVVTVIESVRLSVSLWSLEISYTTRCEIGLYIQSNCKLNL